MSVTAKGKVALHLADGKPLPPGWILDRRGRASVDAADLAAGLGVPIGGHKGYGLALVMEVLAGVLTGAGFGQDHQRERMRRPDVPADFGHLFVAIDPQIFMPLSEFTARVDRMIEQVKAAAPAEEVDEVLLPGEAELRARARNLDEGVPVLPAAWRALQEHKAAAGVEADLVVVPERLPFTRADVEQTIPARFEAVARHFADGLALTGGGRRWTYAELNRCANRLAHAIRERTPRGPGSVALLVGQSPEMVIAVLAILKAGKTYLAIHPRLPLPAQAEILGDIAPELLLTTAELDPRARELAAAACDVLGLEEADERYPDVDPPRVTRPDDASTLFYTSGTTRQAKAVVKSHRAVLHRVWLSTQYDRITPADRQSLLTHCSFSASESDVFGALLQGASLHVFDILASGLTAFGEWIEQERLTLLHPPVLFFRRFLATLEGESLFPSVRLVALAGDVVLPADVQAWQRRFSPSCSLLHRFSLTETALLTVARFEHGTAVDPDFVDAGRPVADKELVLVDAAGEPVPRGEVGELVVRSAYLADGYWRRPAETAAAFRTLDSATGERAYHTGDLGRFEDDGRFVFLGRRDHQVKIRGYRVDTREVEAALLEQGDVAEAAVVAKREDGEARLVAFVVPKSAASWNPVALRARLRALLPEWKVPAQLEVLETLPTTATGKVDRQRLLSLSTHADK
jgi:amino acid adenylation domain-containing protein